MTKDQEQLLRDAYMALGEIHKLEHLQDHDLVASVQKRIDYILKASENRKKAPLARAKFLHDRINDLIIEQDELLTPLCQQAMKGGYKAVLDLYHQLPQGFHATELRTWLNRQRLTGY